MTFEPVSGFQLKCDGCGALALGFEDAYTIHFEEPEDAEDWFGPNEAETFEGFWTRDGDRHLCPFCSRTAESTKEKP